MHATTWALLNGEAQHGITWHMMNPAADVDTGDILLQRSITIEPTETAYSLNVKCAEVGMETFAQLVDQLAAGTTRRSNQETDARTYFGKWQRPSGLGTLDWTQPASTLERQARALQLGFASTNRIGRTSLMFDRDVLLCQCAAVEKTGSAGGAETDQVPGAVLAIEEHSLRMATIDGDLVTFDFSTVDGQPITTADVVKRFDLKLGTVLPPLKPQDREHLDELAAEFARHEPDWIDRLSRFSPVNLPYSIEAQEDSVDNSPAVDVSGVFPNAIEPQTVSAAAAALFLVRLSGDRRFGLGLSCDVLDALTTDVAAFWSDAVPWLIEVDPAIPAADLMTQAAAELSATLAKGTYQRDLVARTPGLQANDTRPAVRVHLGDELPDWPSLAQPTLAILVRPDGSYRLRGSSTADVEALARLASQFEVFLGDIAANPVQPVTQAGLLSDTERQQLLRQWNKTEVPFESTSIVELFNRQVASDPGRLAVAAGSTSLTYGELDRRSSLLAGHLATRGADGESVVGVAVPRGDELTIAVLGVLKAGAAYLPLDPEYPADRLTFMLEDSGAKTVVTSTILSDLLPVGDCDVVLIDRHWDDIAKARPLVEPPLGIDPTQLAYLIYTSGSTGRPKGVMVEHGNVASFFAGMDERIPHQPDSVWLAVTSLSFDISVLELLWTLSRGLTVVIHGTTDSEGGETSAPAAPASSAASELSTVDFSLFYFSADQEADQPYRLLMEGARYADENGFAAVWTPERHFHDFGGLYPNPAVTGAALATATENIDIRAGSVVAPLHSPIRIAEDWSVIDNLSDGRTGVAFASGWMPEDFVIRLDDYADKKQATFTHLDTVRRLWRGETVTMAGPDGHPVDIATLPRPVQGELPCWITTAGNPQTFEMAGRAGANVLTHLLGQSIDELAGRITRYRKAWAEAGHDGSGQVSVMLHTLVGPDHDNTLRTARAPMRDYLASSTNLLRNYASSFPTFRGSGDAGFDDLTDDQLGALLDHAVTRHLEISGLFGTPETCQQRVDELTAIGVDEIACLIDFGVEADTALGGLHHLNKLRLNQDVDSDRTRARTATKATQPIAELVERHHVTHLQCTPSMARVLLADETERQALSRLDVMMVGGEASSPALVNQLTSIVPGRVLNMYGPTKTTIWSLTHHLEDGEETVPIGRPIANTRIYVVNEQLQPQPIGVPGELLIGGPGVTRGYHDRADLTNDRFVVNPFGDPSAPRLYRTGDLVRYRFDGVVEFLGRLDHQVKIRGHRIELGEIEAVLNRHRHVAEAVVVASGDSVGSDRKLVAYVTTTLGVGHDDVSESSLKQQVAEVLPDYMVPARAVVVDAFPQTPNGKIDRARLPAPETVNTAGPSDIDALPSGATEEALATIWIDILDRTNIGRDDEFFRLGGDSLSLIEATSAITDHFGVNVSVADFLVTPTVAGVAAQVAKAKVSNVGLESTTAAAATNIEHASGIMTRPMITSDIDAVVPLHLRYFPNWRVSRLGSGFLHRMYQWHIETHPTLAIVAVDNDDTVIGFTVGTIGSYKRPLFSATKRKLALGLVRHPGAWRRRGSQPAPPHDESTDSIRAKDLALANNRIMALDDIDGGGGYELLIAFELAAHELGTEPYFHTGTLG